jgi:hypothetical protein
MLISVAVLAQEIPLVLRGQAGDFEIQIDESQAKFEHSSVAPGSARGSDDNINRVSEPKPESGKYRGVSQTFYSVTVPITVKKGEATVIGLVTKTVPSLKQPSREQRGVLLRSLQAEAGKLKDFDPEVEVVVRLGAGEFSIEKSALQRVGEAKKWIKESAESVQHNLEVFIKQDQVVFVDAPGSITIDFDFESAEFSHVVQEPGYLGMDRLVCTVSIPIVVTNRGRVYRSWVTKTVHLFGTVTPEAVEHPLDLLVEQADKLKLHDPVTSTVVVKVSSTDLSVDATLFQKGKDSLKATKEVAEAWWDDISYNKAGRVAVPWR